MQQEETMERDKEEGIRIHPSEFQSSEYKRGEAM